MTLSRHTQLTHIKRLGTYAIGRWHRVLYYARVQGTAQELMYYSTSKGRRIVSYSVFRFLTQIGA